MPMNRRGATLPELLVALTVFAVVATANFRSLQSALHWFQRTQVLAEREGQLTASAKVVSSLAAPLSVPAGDVLGILDSSITFLGLVGIGVICREVGGEGIAPRSELASQVPLGAFGSLPQPGDRLEVWREGSGRGAADDQWEVHRIVTVSSRTGECVGGSLAHPVRDAAKPTLRFALQPPLDSSHSGAAFRVLRGRRLALYRSGSEGTLGLAEQAAGGGWAAIQPAAGPLVQPSAAAPGLELVGVDSTTARAVGAEAGLSARLRAPASRPLPRIGVPVDSLAQWVAFRNRR